MRIYINNIGPYKDIEHNGSRRVASSGGVGDGCKTKEDYYVLGRETFRGEGVHKDLPTVPHIVSTST